MELVMTVIAGPGAAGALPELVAALAAALPLAGAPDWLAPGVACDLCLAGTDWQAAEAAARRAIGGAAIDVLVQPSAGRRKRVLVADLESTIIENEMLDELADFIGRRSHVAEITRRAMNGELDFATALAERVALLRGLPESVLDDAASRIRLMPGARALVATCRAAGARTALVSGGFTRLCRAGRGRTRFRAGRRQSARDRRRPDRRNRPGADRHRRDEARDAVGVGRGMRLSRQSATLAVGDGANDLPMLAAAGLGIAFRAKPAVAAAARWRIDHADLTALLYAQGYRADEIVGG